MLNNNTLYSPYDNSILAMIHLAICHYLVVRLKVPNEEKLPGVLSNCSFTFYGNLSVGLFEELQKQFESSVNSESICSWFHCCFTA